MRKIKAIEGMVLCNGSVYSADEIILGVGAHASDWKEMTEAEAIKICDTSNEEVFVDYKAEVERLIRLQYSISDELAVIRQRVEKPIEFESYNAYCEECKMKSKTVCASLGV